MKLQFDLPGKRLGNFSITARRAMVGLASMPFFFAIANYQFDWEFLEGHQKDAIAVAAVALFLVIRYLGPTVQDIRNMRNAKKRSVQ